MEKICTCGTTSYKTNRIRLAARPKSRFANHTSEIFLFLSILLYIFLIVSLATKFLITLNSSVYFVYLAIIPLLIIRLQNESIRQRLGLDKQRLIVYLAFAIFIVLAILSLVVAKYQANLELQTSILDLVLIAPIGEEIFFRGYLQENIKKTIKTKQEYVSIIAVVSTVVLFSIAHFKRVGPIPVEMVFLGSFLLGFVCSYLMMRTQSIFFPMLFHMGWNTGIYIFAISKSVSDFLGQLVFIVVWAVLVIAVLASLSPLIQKLKFLTRRKLRKTLNTG